MILCGGIAQLARALGSYPGCRWFKSDYRYQFGPLVKWLRHHPFTVESWVQFPHGSPHYQLPNGFTKPFGSFSFLRIFRFVRYLSAVLENFHREYPMPPTFSCPKTRTPRPSLRLHEPAHFGTDDSRYSKSLCG